MVVSDYYQQLLTQTLLPFITTTVLVFQLRRHYIFYLMSFAFKPVSSFYRLTQSFGLSLSLLSLDIHKQQLISASYTQNSFRRTRLISSSSDVIFTKSAWPDDSLLCPSWQDPSAVVYPPLYASAFTHLKKSCWGVNNPGRQRTPFDHTFLFK